MLLFAERALRAASNCITSVLACAASTLPAVVVAMRAVEGDIELHVEAVSALGVKELPAVFGASALHLGQLAD